MLEHSAKTKKEGRMSMKLSEVQKCIDFASGTLFSDEIVQRMARIFFEENNADDDALKDASETVISIKGKVKSFVEEYGQKLDNAQEVIALYMAVMKICLESIVEVIERK